MIETIMGIGTKAFLDIAWFVLTFTGYLALVIAIIQTRRIRRMKRDNPGLSLSKETTYLCSLLVIALISMAAALIIAVSKNFV